MKLKTIEVDGKTYAELQDGKPVYLENNGKTFLADVPSMYNKLTGLNAEAQGHREAKETAEAKLKNFDGIDPKVAAKNAEIVKNLDDKTLVEAGEIEKVKNEAMKGFQKQVEEIDKKLKAVETERDTMRASYEGEKRSGAFSSSKFIAERLAIPADMAEATFGKNYVFEDGKMKPVDANGNDLFSKKNPGERADFEESLEIFVDQYAHRDTILKGTGQTGSGHDGIDIHGGKRTIRRAQYDTLPPGEQAKIGAQAAKQEIVIVD